MFCKVRQLIASLLFFGLVFASLARSMPYGWSVSGQSDALGIVLDPDGTATMLDIDVTVAPDVLAAVEAASLSVTADIEVSDHCIAPLAPPAAVLASLCARRPGSVAGSPTRAVIADARAHVDLWQDVDLGECDPGTPCTVSLTVQLQLAASGEGRLPGCLHADGFVAAGFRVEGGDANAKPRESLSSLSTRLTPVHGRPRG